MSFALPSSAGLPVSHDSYIHDCTYSSCILIQSIFVSRLCAPVNRLWAPPLRLAHHRRFFTPTAVVFYNRFYLKSLSYLICSTLQVLYRIFVRHRLSPPVSERAIFSRSQEPDSPFTRHPANRNPIVN
jgi:hypothetical protein